MKTYTAKGVVIGNCWGGGRCGYASERVEANTLKELKEKILAGIEDGSLDSGMGYERVIGAVMKIKTTHTIKKNNKEYHNVGWRTALYGEVPKGFKNIEIQTGGCTTW